MSTHSQLFAKAKGFTPLFATPHISTLFGGIDGKTIPLKDHMLKELEMIAFPQTPLVVTSLCSKSHAVSVFCQEYPTIGPLWTDRRFLDLSDTSYPPRERYLPSLASILESMKKQVGMPYLWGGNAPPLTEMVSWYPPSVDFDKLPEKIQTHWQLKGVDCSGLLYLATKGYTPRNTSELVSFGIPVAIEGKEKNLWSLQGGDLIVWKGHVIIVLDPHRVIESLGGKGVIITPLFKRLEEIESSLERKGRDMWPHGDSLMEKHTFIVRRWHRETLGILS